MCFGIRNTNTVKLKFSIVCTFLVLSAISMHGLADDDKSVSTGTGWLVAPHFVVTNHHVVGNNETVMLILTDNRQLVADVVMRDAINDVAILKPRKLSSLPPGLPIAPASTNVGANVFTIGYPLINIMGREPKLTTGIVNSRTGIANDPRTYQISIPIQPGNSGGPVFNMNGEVIGIATSSLSAAAVFKWAGNIPQNVNYAVKTNYVRALLDAAPIQNKTVISTVSNTSAPLEDLVKRVNSSIVIVLAGKSVLQAEDTPSGNAAPPDTSSSKQHKSQSYALYVYMKPHNYDIRNGNTTPGIDDTEDNYSKQLNKMIKKQLKRMSGDHLKLKQEITGQTAKNYIYQTYNSNRHNILCMKNKVDFLISAMNRPDSHGMMDMTFYIYDCKSKAESYSTHSLHSKYSDTYMYEANLKKNFRTMLEDMPGSISLDIE